MKEGRKKGKDSKNERKEGRKKRGKSGKNERKQASKQASKDGSKKEARERGWKEGRKVERLKPKMVVRQ